MFSRRRLRIICSSDEEDDEEDVLEVQPPLPQHHDNDCETLNFQDVTLSSSNSNPTNQSDCIQVEISDEDFVDAYEDLLPSPQPPPSDQTVHSTDYSRTSSVGMGEVSDSPISRILEDLGLRLRSEWLDSCLHGLQTVVPGFPSFDATKKAKLCFEKFLHFDMNNCGAGMLPDNVHQMHLVDLPGPFVLQVDEIVNISQPLRERYKKAPSGLKRCLKLSMTDGVQQVFGMEYQPIKDLDALAPAGLKVAISNVHIRHGLLMLVPEVFQVLGGLVEELDAARQRLVNEVNKPPRGKRTRTGVVPPLSTRATRAAWPAEEIHVSRPINNPVSQRASPMQVDDRGGTPASVSRRVSSNSAVPVHREHVGHHLPRNEIESSTRRENIEPLPSKPAEQSSVSMDKETDSIAVPIPRGSVDTTLLREEPTIPLHREHAESFPSPIAVTDDGDGDAHMAPAEENHSALSRSSESSFTYLASLSVKWAASKDKASHVEGKIKCILTGVKGFQFKERSTYELQVYVDDGSLISEILVDHNCFDFLGCTKEDRLFSRGGKCCSVFFKPIEGSGYEGYNEAVQSFFGEL
ncbi:recQ-mediated genome instability protein 1 isoform X2 [Cynara cardunculus var. scolymus]|uniref:recQ-mediated genome instability protein 1 isoform X2 n=1 Tax=Cynara cardunculus var. scolymus TaxID=59895 RepID=UPI000D62425D|nr:recQ-mediated genome instability protein 1 isoform X2 [Cynara cardunculus var. scolymus]